MAVLPSKLEALHLSGKVPRLLELSVRAVIQNLSLCIDGVGRLPGPLKEQCLYLMSKRGLITDSNIAKVLHKNVKVLDLSECDVSDDSLLHLNKCPNIIKIDLNAAKQSRQDITSAGVVQMAKTCKHLQTVYLRRCVNLSDESVIALSTHCSQLRLLNIGGCGRISDRALYALGQNSSFLKCVNFSKTQVSDDGVLSLVTGTCAKTLQEIHMDGCVDITDEAVEGVLQFCPQISILIFHGCPKITDQSRQALEEMTRGRGDPMKQVTWTVY